MEEIKYTIYKLIDPESNKVRYIGLTFNTLKQRLKSHYNENAKSHKCYWIKKLKLQGLKPIIESIEENIGSYEEACEKEIYYIDYYKNNGHKLTNQATGGNKNKKMSEETRRKMSQFQKEWHKNNKRILSKETKEKLSESTKIRMQNTEERQRLKIANKLYEDSKTDDQKLADILIQNCKSVYQYDKKMKFIKKYPSINNAVKQTGLHNISKCCHKKVVAVGGYIWRFEGDLTPPTYKKERKS